MPPLFWHFNLYRSEFEEGALGDHVICLGLLSQLAEEPGLDPFL